MAKRLRAPARKSARKSAKPAGRAAESAAGKLRRKSGSKSAPKPAPKPASKPARSYAHLAEAHRHVYTPELLADIRRRYEETTESLASISAEAGIGKTTLRRLVREQKWVRPARAPRDLSPAAKLEARARAFAAASRLTSSSAPRSAGEKEDAASPGEPGSATASPENLPPLAESVERLHADILTELASVEAMRARLGAEPQSPVEAERTAHTLAKLAATLRQIAPIARVPARDKDDDGNDFPTDIDALRDELARRIDAFVASRADAGDAGDVSGNAAAEP